MKHAISNPLNFDRPVSRATILALLSTATRVKEYRFARQASLAWLATFPGDLRVSLILAQTYIAEERFSQAAPLIESLCQKDPEFLPAQKIRGNPQVYKNPDLRTIARGCIYALGGEDKNEMALPSWSRQARAAREALQVGDLARASELIHQAMAVDPPTPIPAILHVQITRAGSDRQAMYNLIDVYYTRWPECLQFKLFKAEKLSETGDDEGSVALLHQCAALDAAGQVPGRLWGPDHPYRPLWPTSMEIPFDIAVPAPIAGPMGWNQLAVGPATPEPEIDTFNEEATETQQAEPTSPEAKLAEAKAAASFKNFPDLLRAIQMEFERLAQRLRRPEVIQSDGRFPIYVIFTTRMGLENQYGPQTAKVLEAEMKRLSTAVSRRHNWGSILFYADDSSSTAAFGLKPVPYNDPWKLKLAIADLDAALAKKGEMIGAMLIVGNSQVVPFHRLPNPTDDGDPDVASDNPYASLDSNFFIPEWPLGRLPGAAGTDAGLLLDSLRKMTSYHAAHSQPVPWWQRNGLLKNFTKRSKQAGMTYRVGKSLRSSFGYSAAVWKQSSIAVFKPIGESQSLLTSPPISSTNLLGTKYLPAQLGYYNLHGLPDEPEWYGQRDVADRSTGPDYPVALCTKDILNSGSASQFVFSEACYGAFIENKTEEQALALKFLATGSSGMVGSTGISYGSVTTPLIAADLLGFTFWDLLKQGYPAGEALKQAKINLVQEMKKRQGFLDGEDQKTLISFVLYGDPLASLEDVTPKRRIFYRQHSFPAIKMISDQKDDPLRLEPLPDDLVAQVKQIVDQYLPGLKDADLSIYQQAALNGELDTVAAGGKRGSKHKKLQNNSARTVVTLSKKVESAKQVHHHYARMTLDGNGKVIKISMSR
ncbi:MAG: hypothetical protein M1281_06555 [Chloroflexi bacterium]|nr:hypothetical protein [Chloroflexota bacterium]